VAESESEQREAQVNLTKVAEEPNQSLKVPTTSFAQEDKLRAQPLCFKLMQLLFIYYIVH
jgi:hypothetical protein